MKQLSPEQEKLREKLRKLSNNISNHIMEHRSATVGRVLTVTDSAIADPDQRKATKNLVEQAMYDTHQHIGGSLGGAIQNDLYRLARSEGFELYEEPTPENMSTLEPANEYDI